LAQVDLQVARLQIFIHAPLQERSFFFR